MQHPEVCNVHFLTWIYTYMYICLYIHLFGVYIHLRIYLDTYAHIHTHVFYRQSQSYQQTFVSFHASLQTYVHTHTCTHTGKVGPLDKVDGSLPASLAPFKQKLASLTEAILFNNKSELRSEEASSELSHQSQGCVHVCKRV
jgi:hypothetical protein